MLTTITTILNLIPAIIAAVKAIEAAIPMSGAGKQKSAMVLQVIEAAGEGTKELLPLVEKAIGIVVNTMNVTGVFKK